MVVGMLDEPLSRFLHGLDLNRTGVVLVSDHGIHTGILWNFGFYSTHLENKLPGWYMALPRWWLDTRPGARQNLEHNEQALVTPYELYATLLDLGGYTKKDVKFKSVVSDQVAARDCDEAKIPRTYCRCH
eukprot:TRINITY_DN2480_c0_g1_i1.p2 TRINITY_DN2480_c0_g1~~TRINITY_DN2480_c0_g1_i1.p2  ORF type:complete len:130 (-),score=37.28 TRINITY_DN2480_c0_g1_i1:48-437(-)